MITSKYAAILFLVLGCFLALPSQATAATVRIDFSADVGRTISETFQIDGPTSGYLVLDTQSQTVTDALITSSFLFEGSPIQFTEASAGVDILGDGSQRFQFSNFDGGGFHAFTIIFDAPVADDATLGALTSYSDAKFKGGNRMPEVLGDVKMDAVVVTPTPATGLLAISGLAAIGMFRRAVSQRVV